MKAGKRDSHNFRARRNNKTRDQIRETRNDRFSMLIKTLERLEKRKYDK